MISAFNPTTGTWEINWPERVSRHDLVYLTPPDDPVHGMAIGNGEVGALCWFESSKIMMVINKSDLWDDAEFTRFHNWDQIKEEERSTTLRHGGRLIIDFHAPVFDLFYLYDCHGRLSLADGTVKLSVSGPFGKVSFNAFVDHVSNILCCQVKTDLAEDLPMEITLERYGSRMTHHWYSVHRSAQKYLDVALKGTESRVDDSGMYVTHQLTSGTFALGCRVDLPDDLSAQYRNPSAYFTQCTVSGKREKEFSLFVTATSPLAKDPVVEVKKQIDSACARGIDALFLDHAASWKAFWLRSLMETGHEFLDDIWHLQMYYARSSQGGRYPGRFIGGLWNHSRDFQAWGFYFHWNQQQVYWPMNAAGHHDLVGPYLDWRFQALPHAMQDARELLGADGAAVADVVERRGYNSVPELNNHTPGAQIAMDFWRQYQFTGDETFLRERALPYMIESAKYFETLFSKGDDGIYHGNHGCGYEGLAEIRDCITELATARALFPAVLDALQITGVKDDHVVKWRDILDHLSPFPMVQPGHDMIKRENYAWKYTRGLFKGETAVSDRTLAAGYILEEESVQPSLIPYEPDTIPTGIDIRKLIMQDQPLPRIDAFFRKMVKNENPFVPATPHVHVFGTVFPFVEYAVVYPSGVVGLSQKNSSIFKAAINTVKLYAGYMNGWDPVMIVMTRLGLAREAYAMMLRAADEASIFPSGFFADGTAEYVGVDGPLKLRCMHVDDWDKDANSKERHLYVPSKPFRHIGMEAPSILAGAMNESLLQSYDGVLRVGPAADKTRLAHFTLHAEGGFIVSSEIENGIPRWIYIESRLGKTAKLENPWTRAFLFRNGSLERETDDRIIEFSTCLGDRMMWVPDSAMMAEWQMQPQACRSASEPRWSPNEVNILGLPRMF